MDVFLPVRFTGAAPSHGFRRMFAVRACVRVPHLGIKALISSRREKKRYIADALTCCYVQILKGTCQPPWSEKFSVLQ